MLENLSRHAFAEQLNTKFGIYFTPEQATESELVEVTEIKKYNRQEAFSIVFLAPIEQPYEQGIYKVAHPIVAEIEIFIVPVKKTVEGIKYEAVVNRLAE